ncbi:MAG: hypothetical protein RLZZ267_41 [Bacillota bacterium]|jgi:hypothetical protein
MTRESEKIIFGSNGVIEKLSGEDTYKKPFCPPVYLQYYEDNARGISETHIIVGGYQYPVDINQIEINDERGTVSFRAFDGTYLIRTFHESDSEWFAAGIPLTSNLMEKIMEIDGQVGTSLSVEVLVEEAAQEVVAIVFNVENLGVFFRINQRWEPATAELAAQFDGAVCFDIIYQKAKDLVGIWDAGKKIRMIDLVGYIDASND